MTTNCTTAILAAALLAGASASTQGAEPSPALGWNCNGCHGAGGASVGPAVPSIAGMDPRYFFKVMRDFKYDERGSTVMGRIAKGYGTKDMRAMASYFASRDWVPAELAPDPARARAGERIHDEHCAECHEDGGRYQDKEVPRLAGQWPDYLVLQMEDYRNGEVVMPQPDKMRERLAELSQEDLVALGAFYGQVDERYVSNDDDAAPPGQASDVGDAAAEKDH